jgi:hypothetical protein
LVIDELEPVVEPDESVVPVVVPVAPVVPVVPVELLELGLELLLVLDELVLDELVPEVFVFGLLPVLMAHLGGSGLTAPAKSIDIRLKTPRARLSSSTASRLTWVCRRVTSIAKYSAASRRMAMRLASSSSSRVKAGRRRAGV